MRRAEENRTPQEQLVNDLNWQLLSAKNPVEAELIGDQLRSAIHEHVQDMRRNVVSILPALDADTKAA